MRIKLHGEVVEKEPCFSPKRSPENKLTIISLSIAGISTNAKSNLNPSTKFELKMTLPNPPTVSIIIPAFNRSSTIISAIESVLRQTYKDFELLIVDDGSTDETMSRVAEISDPRIRMLSNPQNMGASAARNNGIKNARGKWIAFQDSDDEWLPEKLQKQMNEIAAQSEDYIACYCGMLVVGEYTQSEQERTLVRYIPSADLTPVEGNILTTLLRANPASTQTLLIQKDVLTKIGGFDESLPALVDWDCNLRLVEHGLIAFVDEPLVLQYFSQNSITRSHANRAAARLKIITKNRHLWNKHPKLLAQQFRSVAGAHRRLGNLDSAKTAISEACRINPYSIKLRAISVYLFLHGLFSSKGKTGT